MELLGELKECVFWLASCIGPDPLLAVFNKPSVRLSVISHSQSMQDLIVIHLRRTSFSNLQAPNMIIIEVARAFDNWSSLLGEHKWGEFLRNPTFEEKDRVSQIFYCTFTTGRKVQKHGKFSYVSKVVGPSGSYSNSYIGWKRNDVESSWFNGWTPYNRIIIQPYPATSYCPTPPEDKTNAPLCRPLPVKSFPPPPPPRQPPVGSPEWLKRKDEETKGVSAPAAPHGAWGLGHPSTRTSAPGSTRAGPARGVPSLAAGSTRPGAPARTITAPNGPTLPPGINIAAPLTIPSRSANSSNQASPSTLASPGSPDSDGLGVPPALTRGPSAASGSSDGSGSGQLTPSADGHHANGEQLANAIAALELDDEWDGEGDDSLLDQQWAAGGYIAADPPEDENVPATEPQFQWAGYTFNEAANGPTEPEIECKEHGKLCKKGICKQYKAQKREIERQKEAEERAAEKERKIIEKKKRKKEGPTSKTKYNILPARTAQTPGTLRLPTDSGKVPDSGWSKAPAGAAVSPISQTIIDPSGGDAGNKRPAKGRRMNAAGTAPTAAQLLNGSSVPTTRAAGPASDGGSTTGGWGNISTGPWGGSVPAGANKVATQKPKPVSSVASTGSGWGNVSTGPWGAPAGAQAIAHASMKKPPSSVASGGSGWGNVSNGPWGPPPGAALAYRPPPNMNKGPSSVASGASGWGHVSDVAPKKKGPSSVASSASGWGKRVQWAVAESAANDRRL
ncbi:hypothetical protein EUX98_g6853 [Antrodiella citrinella]|uniref:Uncharacterized protein n=1 Tax=Antrodiella citrinella TaxID=2447956 RepID=A0A4S4MPR5_9APHY|nr:hypothetical protein EUX98_g6853 [Antrodiella citrinella]